MFLCSAGRFDYTTKVSLPRYSWSRFRIALRESINVLLTLISPVFRPNTVSAYLVLTLG